MVWIVLVLSRGAGDLYLGDTDVCGLGEAIESEECLGVKVFEEATVVRVDYDSMR